MKYLDLAAGLPQGLKPNFLKALTARLKAVPFPKPCPREDCYEANCLCEATTVYALTRTLPAVRSDERLMNR